MTTTEQERGQLRPAIFGRYCLLERLNIGGMAEIFRARPFNARNFKRYLAIKRILPNLADDEEFIEMFVDEARITVQLAHPNIAQIYELGRHKGTYYIVMEYIAGADVLSLINYYRRRRETLPPAQVAYIVSRIADGLAYAHAKVDAQGRPLEIIHRDISPQNVLLGFDGAVKIIDFGIARASLRRSRTESGVLKGKFGYMSPEQVSGRELDHRSDIFALGILCWEMLTARRLFYSRNDYEILDRVRNMEIPPPSVHNPQVPPELDAIVLRALERDIHARFQSAGELREALQGWLNTLKPPYDAQVLASWMRSAFRERIEDEERRAELFDQFVRPRDVLRHLHRYKLPMPEEALSVGDITALSAAELSELETNITGAETELLAENPNETVPELIDEANYGFGETSSLDEADGTVGRTDRPTLFVAAALAIVLVVASLALFWQPWSEARAPLPAEVEIRVSPANAQVRVDGAVLDGPPWNLIIEEPGIHELELDAPGYDTLMRRLEVEEGERVVLDLSLSPREDAVREVTLALPELDTLVVAVDGDVIESFEDALVLDVTPARNVRVDVYSPGFYPEQYSIGFSSADHPPLVELRPIETEVVVTSDPPGRVLVNGEFRGRTSEALAVDGLAPFEPYEIVIEPEQPGFTRWTRRLSFDGSFQRRVHAQLSRIGQASSNDHGPGVLRFIGDGFFLVEIDQRSAAFATGPHGVEELALSAGSHNLVLRRGERIWERQVQIRPGRQVELELPTP